MPSVAAIVIGDEILSGKFPDQNGPFLIRRLRELGADLVHLVTITDGIDAIAEEVARCAERADLVITTGGVGPTHDDRTLEGVARAFDLPLQEHPELISLLARFNMDLNPAARRMATVPRGTELIASEGSGYPVLRVGPVFVFPGVPKLMQIKFEAVSDLFRGTPVGTARLYTAARETEIAAALGSVQDRFPTVAIGSYPRSGEAGFAVIITLESRDLDALGLAEAALRGQVDVVEPGNPG